MTEIEKRALALLNEVLRERGCSEQTHTERGTSATAEALCRAIERHDAFRQRASDAIERWDNAGSDLSYEEGLALRDSLARFIIAKPDPLVEVFRDAFSGTAIGEIGGYHQIERNFRAALAARNLEIVEKKS